MSRDNPRLGIFLMIATTFVFAMQDGISRYLAGEYNVLMVVMIRYWFFAAFVIALASRSRGGIARAARTEQPWLQAGRGVLLALEICVMVLAFTLLGLVESHAVFTCYPLLIAALSGPILGERVGWRRWAAIGVGFIGVLVILQPGVAGVRGRGADPAHLRLHVRALRPSDPLCRAQGPDGDELLLDRDRGRGGDDGNRRLVLGTDGGG
jgi:drug/metabolite transporter (DMT)-like permease